MVAFIADASRLDRVSRAAAAETRAQLGRHNGGKEMPTTFTLIDLAGSIALLLLGTQMAQTGMQRAFAVGLEPFLLRSRDRCHAFLAGMGVTAVLQSSTATGSMAAGLATRSADLVPALAVLLGANIGATLVVQVLLFDFAAVSPALILVGVLMFRKTSNTRAHDLGRAFIGLGLMLLALHELLDLMTDYEDAPSLRMMLGAATAVPLVDVMLAASLTWAGGANLAAVLLIASLGAKNVVPPDTAFALVLGANLGTAIKPVLDCTCAQDAIANRLPIGNLLIVMTGVVLALAALGPIGRFMVTIEPDNGRVVADFHTLFNGVVAIVFLPLLVPYANFLGRLIPALIKVAGPSVWLDGDPGRIAVQRESYDRAIPSGLRLKGDPAELLVSAGPGPAVCTRVHSGEGRQRNDAAGGDESNGYAPLGSLDKGRSANLPDKAIGSIWLTLEDLRIVRYVEPVAGERQSVLVTCVQGMARLDEGYLCVRGDPCTKGRKVSVTFIRRDVEDKDYQGLREWQDTLGITFSDVPVGTARLGYNPADDEMQEPGQWWAVLHVAASGMHGLVEGIEGAQLTEVRLALTLKNLYSFRPDIGDGRNDACLFLGRDCRKTSDLPEVATGYVTHLTFDLARIKLGAPDDR